MAKITNEARELYEKKVQPYTAEIDSSTEKEKSILALVAKDTSGIGYKKLLLCDEMIYQASVYMIMNSLSLQILGVRNNDVLNDARKALYKAIIYLEEVVTNIVNCPYSEIEDKVSEISNTPLEKRYYQIRKLGLAIRMLVDAFGDNSKWRWSFVELEGRFAVVAKNMIDMKKASKDYFDPRSPDYDNSVYCMRLLKSLLAKSAADYRDRYELSTRRIDDMRMGINFNLALRRLCIALGQSEEAEEVKKKAMVWNAKMEADQKAGLSK